MRGENMFRFYLDGYKDRRYASSDPEGEGDYCLDQIDKILNGTYGRKA